MATTIEAARAVGADAGRDGDHRPSQATAWVRRRIEWADNDPVRLVGLLELADELRREAALAIGALVPPPARGVGRGAKASTVGKLAESTGIPRVTLQNYRALHQAARREKSTTN